MSLMKSRFFTPAVTCLVLLFLFISACSDDDPTEIPNNNNTVPLTVVVTGGGAPTVSPDGRSLAFVDPDGNLMKLDFGKGTPVDLGVDGDDPAWSPQGDVIVFVNNGGIFTVPASGGPAVSLYDIGYTEGPSWSPAGDKIVVQDQNDLMRIISYPAGDMITVLNCEDPVDGDCESEGPTWSGLGDWIAFEDGLEIMRLLLLGGTAETVVGGLNDVSYPAYSPDGLWVAFTMDNDGHDTGNNIWVADARGQANGLHQVTDSATTKFRPCWTPNSQTLYFEDRGVYDSDTGYPHDGEIWKIGFDPGSGKLAQF